MQPMIICGHVTIQEIVECQKYADSHDSYELFQIVYLIYICKKTCEYALMKFSRNIFSRLVLMKNKMPRMLASLFVILLIMKSQRSGYVNIVCTLVHILTSLRTKYRQRIFQYTDNDEVLTKMYRSQMNLTENIKSKAYSKINQGKMAII